MKEFKQTFGLTVYHGALSFGLMAVHGERGCVTKGNRGIDVQAIKIPGLPDFGVPSHLNKKYAGLVRESTRRAREKVIVRSFFADAFGVYQAGDRERAEELYRLEWAALMGESLWPVPSVIDLATLSKFRFPARHRFTATALEFFDAFQAGRITLE